MSGIFEPKTNPFDFLGLLIFFFGLVVLIFYLGLSIKTSTILKFDKMYKIRKNLKKYYRKKGIEDLEHVWQ
jgi:hypothetical protein